MSTFRRLIGTAQKALDSSSSSSSRSGRGSDWRDLVRSAADSLTGDTSSSRDSSSSRDPHRTTSAWDDTPHRAPQTPDTSRTSGVGIPTTSMPSLSDERPGHDAGPARDTADISTEDRRAIARYDYLVRTAEPDQLERVHREAFERLTPAQRAQLEATMREELPEGERPRSEAPQDLARSATRLAAFDPRRLTGLLGRSGGSRSAGGRGRGLGAAALGAGGVGALALGAGGLLAAVAGGAVLSSVGGSLLSAAIGDGIDVDALAPDLGDQLAGFTEGFEGVEGLEGVDGIADGFGGGVTDLGDQLSGLGDQISDFGLGDLFGR
ncbi:hypothetical protein V1260_05550 [Brachybacterium sp. J144]|uniref:hypothetical protein n=1 Tax=Brachybacterium sp. J144 TaxID=3116487 RepID=UPI002E79600E|nr:hypothetical protein [Brachybacterium sp. J144]MEE1650252.1 hypothetical protein [Brachybacterium sp. J144]